MAFALTALSGWLAILLLGAAIGIPYLARIVRMPSLKPHYWLGFLVPTVVFVHASLPMSSGRLSGSGRIGMLLATAALLLMVWQAGVGVSLRRAKGIERRSTRRIHFWTVLVVVCLVGGHVALNRA